MKPPKMLRYFYLPLAGIAALAVVNAQTPIKQDKASAYYHYALGHVYAELAGTYGNKGDFVTKAIENYRLAMKEDPSVSFLSEELSDLYIQAGKLREAVLEAEESLKQNPKDTNSRRILGRIYTRMIGDSQQGRIDENMLKKAIEQYQKIVEQEPGDTDTWLTLGRMQSIAHNSVEAEKAYKKVLEYEADNEDALTGLATVYADLGNTKAASELLAKLADKSPNLRTVTLLARNYEEMREYALAAETYKRALTVAPGNIEIKKALAQNLMLSDQLTEALKLYQEAVAEDNKDVQSQIRISQIYRQQKDFAKARDAAAKAKEMDPSNLEVRYNEVNLLESEGKLPEAIKVLKDMITQTTKRNYTASEKSSRVMLLERMAMLYRSNDQFREAADTFRQIADLDAEFAPRALAQVVDTYRLGKDLKKALEEADAAAQKFPTDRTVRAIRASVLADAGKTDEAVTETKKLLDGFGDQVVRFL